MWCHCLLWKSVLLLLIDSRKQEPRRNNAILQSFMSMPCQRWAKYCKVVRMIWGSKTMSHKFDNMLPGKLTCYRAETHLRVQPGRLGRLLHNRLHTLHVARRHPKQ